MISMKMTLGCRALSILLFCLPVLCLILDAPYGSNLGPSILSNGLARIDWIPEVDGSDPVMFNIELKNNVTGDSYELAQHVVTNLWTTVVPVTDVVPGHGYFIQAVNISHHSQVYNSSAFFTVSGATPSSSASSPVRTVYYGGSSVWDVYMPPGVIAGIVVGTLIGVALLVCAVAWFVRRRYMHKTLGEKPRCPFPNVSHSYYAPVTANPVIPKASEEVVERPSTNLSQSKYAPTTATRFSPMSTDQGLPGVPESKELFDK
ncbi:hypothetical protein C8J56DRAFT_908665 [Mycena floridula]|nr:hypothetical protein C8J56DRAFT_908665 [Mycena floridula]